jgi:hypothetical protein
MAHHVPSARSARWLHILSFSGAAALVLGATIIARTDLVPDQPSAPVQSQTPVFTSRIDLMRLDVRVMDRRGRPVTDLTQRDFTIYENGVQQEIRAFARQTFDAGAREVDGTSTRGPLTPHERRVFLRSASCPGTWSPLWPSIA